MSLFFLLFFFCSFFQNPKDEVPFFHTYVVHEDVPLILFEVLDSLKTLAEVLLVSVGGYMFCVCMCTCECVDR